MSEQTIDTEKDMDMPVNENIIVSKRNSRFGRRTKVAFFAGILIVSVGIGAWLWLARADRAEDSDQQLSAIVCGADVVSDYNAAMFYRTREGSTAPSLDTAALSGMAEDIKTMAKFETDPTCETILFWAAVQKDDYAAAKEAYDVVKSLHEEGKFADTNLRTNEPLFTYEQYINNLSGSGVKQVEESVGG